MFKKKTPDEPPKEEKIEGQSNEQNPNTKEGTIPDKTLQIIEDSDRAESIEDKQKIQEQIRENMKYNENEVCHRILYKGCSININHYMCFPCSKIKEKESFFSTIGLSESKLIEKNYLIFFDETYMYLVKNIIYDQSRPYLRWLGNKYNMKNFINVTFEKESTLNLHRLLIETFDEKNNDEYVEKEYFFQESVVIPFYIVFSEYLAKLGKINEEEEEEYNKEEYMEDDAEYLGDNEEEKEIEGTHPQEGQKETIDVPEDNKEGEENKEEGVEETKKEKKVKKKKKIMKKSSTPAPEEGNPEQKANEESERAPEVKHKKKKKVLKMKKKKTNTERELAEDEKTTATNNESNPSNDKTEKGVEQVEKIIKMEGEKEGHGEEE